MMIIKNNLIIWRYLSIFILVICARSMLRIMLNNELTLFLEKINLSC